MAPPSGIRVAQTVGITSAAFVAGGTLAISYLTVPTILTPQNKELVRQWRRAFEIGKWTHQIVGAISLGSFAWLAYKMEGTLDQHRAEIYGICAVLDFLIWPWTVLIILPTNTKLFARHDRLEERQVEEAVEELAGVGSGEESSKTLIQRWSNLNIVRGSFPLVAALLGMWATVS